MKPHLLIFTAFAILQSCERDSSDVSSPDGTLKVNVYVDSGVPVYDIRKDNILVLDKSKLGLVLNNADLSGNLTLSKISHSEAVTDSFKMLHGKRTHCSYRANRRIYSFRRDSLAMDIIFQVSNDGVTFRYCLNGKPDTKQTVLEEQTTFSMPSLEAKAFLQPMSEAKSGWAKVNPCYEEFYKKEIKAGTPSPSKAGWVFPALFQTGENWIHITEAGLSETYCGTRLHQLSPNGEYKIDFPDSLERFPGGNVIRPQFTLPWKSPWRVLTIGSLKNIIESDLGVAVSDPQKLTNADFVKPGHASWSWALLKDNSVVYSIQHKFIDYAAEMRWEYCLIDVNWDTKIGYNKIKELAGYAASKGIGLFLWYNSSGDWNDTSYTPKSKLLTRPQREQEFSLLHDMGIKGVKIDFFGGDGQSVIQYYLDILEDAAKYKLMVNFHGATIPRGWHRTYPHLMSMEAVRGFEYVTFEQANADEQPSHCTVIPFTRNLFDPADFTPLSLDTIPRINRKTTRAYELALSIVLYSGVQHFAETPQGMSKMPLFVKEFLADLPTQWDDTKFIAGYPGKDFVLARRYKNRWYLAGINGENKEKIFKMDLSFMKNDNVIIIKDKKSEKRSLIKELIEVSAETEIIAAPNGGFVVVGEEVVR